MEKRFTALKDRHFLNLSNFLNRFHRSIQKITSLGTPLLNKGGRSKGQIVSPRRGNLGKRNYRFADFKRSCFQMNQLFFYVVL